MRPSYPPSTTREDSIEPSKSPAFVFISDGDLRDDVTRYVQEIGAEFGLEAASAMLEARYFSNADRTIVMIEAWVSEWRDLMLRSGWQQLPPRKD